MSSLYTKISPKGIDIPIQQMQTHLFDELSDTWSTTSYSSFGRCYKNTHGLDGGLLPEVFAGTDYFTLLDIDKGDAFSFFVDNNKTAYEGGQYTTEVSIIFFCNLKKLKSSITHRADEEVRIDVQKILETRLFGFELIGIETGEDNVFSGFDEDFIKNDDLQPYHCFKVNTILKYNINTNCN